MTSEQILAAFVFSKDRPLQLTFVRPDGSMLAQNVLCMVKPPPPAMPHNENMIVIDPIYSDFMTYFNVDELRSEDDGTLVLKGPKGTAMFRVLKTQLNKEQK